MANDLIEYPQSLSYNTLEPIACPLWEYRRLPFTSFEKWPVNNCAEVDALNRALQSGAEWSYLEVLTVRVKSGEIFAPCKNCESTLKGTVGR